MCTLLERFCEGKQISPCYEMDETADLVLAKGNHFVVVVFLLLLFISWLSVISIFYVGMVLPSILSKLNANYSWYSVNQSSESLSAFFLGFHRLLFLISYSTNALKEVLSSNASSIKSPFHSHEKGCMRSRSSLYSAMVGESCVLSSGVLEWLLRVSYLHFFPTLPSLMSHQ